MLIVIQHSFDLGAIVPYRTFSHPWWELLQLIQSLPYVLCRRSKPEIPASALSLIKVVVAGRFLTESGSCSSASLLG